jgi:hypothetical protein
MKIIIIILNITQLIAIRLKQLPFDDGQYRQGTVPPLITTIIDIPAYGNK